MTASTNVMSVGLQPSAGIKSVSGGARQSARTGGRAHTDAQGNGKFGKVLDQTQDNGKISGQDAAGKPDEVMDVPKDPIAAAIAASSQQSNPSEGSAAAETEETAAQQVSGSRQAAGTLLQAVSESMDDPETMAAEFLRNTGKSQNTSAENSVLQTLLPQTETDGAKGKSMLNMLSGRNWRTADAPASVQSENPEMIKEAAEGLMNGKTAGTPQTVQSAGNTQVSQQDGQLQQQMMQQGRSQAQPGMQGMPVMQDAQAPLTRPAQTETEPQTAVMSEEQGTAWKLPEISREQKIPEESVQRGIGTENPELQERKNMGMPEAVKSQAAQPDLIQQDPVQMKKNGASENTISGPLIRHDDAEEMPVSKQQLPTELKAAEETLKKPEALQSAAAETAKKTRQDLSELLGTQVASESADEQREVNPIRQMMHGQQQSGEGRQQPHERQPLQSMAQENLKAADEMTENRTPVQNISPQNAGEVHVQSHQAGGFQQVLNTTQSQTAENTQAPAAARQDYNIPQQIVEQARLIRSSDNTEMVIHLKPEHLGDLTLKVSVSGNGAVTASFHSDNAQVRAIIENSLVQLRQELSNQGIKVDNVEVYAGLSGDSLMNGQGQQAWQQNQQGGSSRNRNLDFDSYEEEGVESSVPAGEQGVEDGVDYRV